MKIEYLTHAVFTRQDVVNALIDQLEIKMNDEVVGSDLFNRLNVIVGLARNGYADIDFYDDRFVLLIDGVAFEEILDGTT